MDRKTLVLADDHAVVLEGLARLLGDEFEVAAMVTDGRALISAAARLQPDVAVLDLGMPLLNGIDASRQLRQVAPGVLVVFLTQHSGKEYVQSAFAAGARGYVVKNSAAVELRTALNEVLSGRYYLSPELRQKYGCDMTAGTDPSTAFAGGLTPRQREVLQLVAEGKSAKEIGHVLGISVKTVEFHKNGIMDELGIRTTAELTRYALEHGLVA